MFKKGFSLAEMMVVILIMSIILAAAAPIITKKSSAPVASSASNPIPPGTILPYSGKSAPDGWLFCDGSGYDTTKYKNLYNAINGTFGSNLPDLRGRVIVELDQMQSFKAAGRMSNPSLHPTTLGATGGVDSYAMQLNEMPTHNHGGTTGQALGTINAQVNVSISGKGLSPNYKYTSGEAFAGAGLQEQQGSPPRYGGYPLVDLAGSGTTSTVNIQNHWHSIQSQGSGAAHENMPPYMALNYIIKY